MKKLKKNKHLKRCCLFFKKDFRILLPQLYIIVLIAGFILTLLYAVFPQLVICTQLLGQDYCTPVGIYVGLFASLPGYLIAGNIVPATQSLPSIISFIIVVVVSAIFYFVIGLLIDKYRERKTSKVYLFILTVFVVLLIALLILLALIS